MKRGARLLGLTSSAALALAAVAGGGVSAQQPLFRSAVSVVRVDVLASDGGRPIPNLTGSDFEVLDNGIPQQVDSVIGDSEPLDVLFAFDRSGSTRGETILRLRESASALLEALDSDDRAGLLAFNHTVRLVVPLGPTEPVRRAVREMEPDGSTALFDATSVALALTAGSSRRSLVLLFTDGVDTLSWLPERTVIEAARASEAVLYVVALPERSNQSTPLMGDAGPLRRLAEATGGRLLRASQPAQLRERFIDILGEMRARYVLTYTPSGADAPGWHTLTVRLKTRRGRIASRAGYIVPSD